MNEVEKMMQNANIKQDRMCEWTCKGNEFCSTNCEHYESTQLYYPPFTAEKQLELIKWLLEKWTDVRFVHNLDGIYYISSFNNVSYTGKNLEECIASFVNNAWQDLTDTEKAQIKEILE